MFIKRKNERGQMLVIVAVALTALVAMAGLVIDGGMALANRRQVQNAADAASLAGARVLGLDLKWRAVNSSNPSPPDAPFADPDDEVCRAINRALGYNANPGQAIEQIDCYSGSDDAVYVNFDRAPVGRVGQGIPSTAQGVQVLANGESGTFLMGVVGINSVDVGADATALAGPGAPPLGLLMPFVVQNPLGPFVPGQQYQVRSESEGECGASLDSTLAWNELGIVLAAARDEPVSDDAVLAAPGGPSIPVADPAPESVAPGWGSITVSLSSSNGAKIYYTTDGSEPTAVSPEYSGPLTFTSTTLLRAIAIQGGKSSDIGNFLYAKEEPPPPPTASEDSQEFTGSLNVTLTADRGSIHYTTNGTTPTNASPTFTGPIPISASTQLKAIAYDNFQSSTVASWTYTLEGDPLPPVADPESKEFETTQNVTLSSEAGTTIYYTFSSTGDPDIEYTGTLSLVATTTIRAWAERDDDGATSAIAQWTYTKTGEVCPDLTAGNFGWIDFGGGSSSNADLIDDIENPQNADTGWYYDFCTSSTDTNCRKDHGTPDDWSDDHWRLEGTTGHRSVSLETACELYLGKVIYVPIWDSFETMPKKPNGNNAVFHLIGFAAFRLDGTIDNTGSGNPSNKACGEGINSGGTPNDKGFIGTYVDSFVGSQVSECIADGSNPCSNASNTGWTINLAR